MARARTAGCRQSELAQPASQRGDGWPAAARQDAVQFFGTPARILGTQLPQPLAPMCRPRPAMEVGRTRTRPQTCLTLGLITMPVGVAGLAADLKRTTQSGERMRVRAHRLHKLPPPLHRQ